MRHTRQKKIPLATQLGHLAMQFRGARDEAMRATVAKCYEHIVKKLIRLEKWDEMPAFEDMLPDEWMPEAFFKFWSIPSPRGYDDSEHPPMTLTVTYPLFILMDGKVPVIIDGREGKARVPTLAVFTDKEAAEQCRDKKVPNGKVAILEDEEAFATALKPVRELIALNPHRVGKRMKTIPVDEMLRQLLDKPRQP